MVDEYQSVTPSYIDGFLLLGVIAVWVLTFFNLTLSVYWGLNYAIPITVIAWLLYKFRKTDKKPLILILRSILFIVAFVALCGVGICAMFLTGNIQM